MARIDTLTNFLTDVADSIRSKTGKSDTISCEDFDTEIESISGGANLQTKSVTITENGTTSITPDTGYDGLDEIEVITNVSGGPIFEKDVNFYDYDGTLVNSYTKAEFLSLASMPDNPTHSGLIAEGWNWNLTNAQTYVENYGKLNVGQIYTTASGLSEFDIEITAQTGLSVTLRMNGTKNWGDGTTDTATTHTYSTLGNYTITCDGTTLTSSQNNSLFGSGYKYYVKNVRFANITRIGGYAFQNCYSLKTITIPNGVTYIGSYVFGGSRCLINVAIPNSIVTFFGGNYFSGCTLLKNVELPNSITDISTDGFYYCYSLKSVTIPSDITTIGKNYFAYCYSLKMITIPSGVTSIGNYVFSTCWSLEIADFSKLTTIPALGSSAFSNASQLLKIVVPDNLYDEWIAATNWSNWAAYIVKASEV